MSRIPQNEACANPARSLYDARISSVQAYMEHYIDLTNSLHKPAYGNLHSAVHNLIRAPKDHINMRITQNMISGIDPVYGLSTRISDPYVYVVLWAPIYRNPR